MLLILILPCLCVAASLDLKNSTSGHYKDKITIVHSSLPSTSSGKVAVSPITYANNTIYLLFKDATFKTALVDAPIVLKASIEYSPDNLEYKYMFGYSFNYLAIYPSVFVSVSGIGMKELRFYLYMNNGTGIVYPPYANASDFVEGGHRDWWLWTSTDGYGASSGVALPGKLSNVTLGGRLLLQGFILHFEDGSEVSFPDSQLLLTGMFHLQNGHWTSDVGVWDYANKTTYLGNSDISIAMQQTLPLSPIVLSLVVLSISSVVVVISLVIIRRGVRYHRSPHVI